MREADFTDAALVLLGHGSTVSAAAAAPVYQHADELRRRGGFAQVLTGFWKLEPGLAGVLRGAFARRVFIVPLFISEGYFTREVLPRELGLRAPGAADFSPVQSRGEQTLHYCAPVGTHARMTEVIRARARAVVEQFPFPFCPRPGDTALIVAGHGTSLNEDSRAAIEAHAAALRWDGGYGEVHAAFLEEAPRIADFAGLTTRRNVVVVPFFISEGPHSQVDIPVALGEPETLVRERLDQGRAGWRNPTERQGKRIWYAGPVGTDPVVAEVILERVRESAASGG